MDTENEQQPKPSPLAPEQAPPRTPRPEVGAKPDLVNPQHPDAARPEKPVPDMDPDGQDPDENENMIS